MWALVGVLLLSVMVSVRMDVLFSYYGNDQYTALQVAFEGASAGNDAVRDSGIRGFWFSIVVFALLVVTYLAQTLLDLYLMQFFIIRWRVWLTDRLTATGSTARAYYRGRFLRRRADRQPGSTHPAGHRRVHHRARGRRPNTPTVGTSTTLLFGAVYSIVSVVAFTPILWNLSGPLDVLRGDGAQGPVLDRAARSWPSRRWSSFWIGRPIIRLSFRNEMTNAAFRYALVRVRDAAEAVGFSRGERVERSGLSERFARIIVNYRRLVLARGGVPRLEQGRCRQIVDPLPLIVQAPRLFAGEINLGDVSQSSSAFRSVQSSLSFFRAVYDSFASYRATIIRLDGLLDRQRNGKGARPL